MAPKKAATKTTVASEPKQSKKRARDAKADDSGLAPRSVKRSKQAGQGFAKAKPSTGAAPAAASPITNASSWPVGLARTSSRGMRNPGMFCYRNATLQALLHAPEFISHLNSYEEWCQAGPGTCITCSARRLAFAYWQKGFYFSQKLTAFNDTLTPRLGGAAWGNVRVQQDAGEFFGKLVDCLRDPAGAGSESHAGADPAVSNLFDLVLSEATTCGACSDVKNGAETIQAVRLGESSNQDTGVNIEDNAIRDFFQSPAAGSCDACKAEDHKTLVRKIIKAPTILAVQVPTTREVKNRRDNGTHQEKRQKYSTYPVKLQLQQFAADETPLGYTLYAIVAHVGPDLSTGHYIAVATEPDGSVSTINDNKVYRCNTAQIGEARLRKPVLFESELTQDVQPYLLFYRKD